MATSARETADIDLIDVAPFAAGDQYAAFRHLRDHAPVHWNTGPDAATIPGDGFWALTRHEHVAAIARDHRGFVSGRARKSATSAPRDRVRAASITAMRPTIRVCVHRVSRPLRAVRSGGARHGCAMSSAT